MLTGTRRTLRWRGAGCPGRTKGLSMWSSRSSSRCARRRRRLRLGWSWRHARFRGRNLWSRRLSNSGRSRCGRSRMRRRHFDRWSGRSRSWLWWLCLLRRGRGRNHGRSGPGGYRRHYGSWRGRSRWDRRRRGDSRRSNGRARASSAGSSFLRLPFRSRGGFSRSVSFCLSLNCPANLYRNIFRDGA